MGAEFYLSTEFYKAEPFAQLPYSTTWLWFQSVSWTCTHDWKGRIPAVVVRHHARRTHERKTKELIAAGLWSEEEPGVYRIAREINGLKLWRQTLPINPRRYIPTRIRRAVFDRDGHACITCRATEHLSLDHIYPYSLGGPDTIDNLQTMCQSCNSRKGAYVDGP